jgi:hypothetical protein
MRTTSPRSRCEVFFNEGGTISLTQRAASNDDQTLHTIALHPDDISDLIEVLEEARREAAVSLNGEPPTARRLKPVK